MQTGLVAHGPIQTLEFFVKTDATLVKRIIVPENVSLAGFALSERVEDWFGEGVCAVGYRIKTLLSLANDLV